MARWLHSQPHFAMEGKVDTIAKLFVILALVLSIGLYAEEQKPAAATAVSGVSTGCPSFSLNTAVFSEFVNFSGKTVSSHPNEVETFGFKLPDLKIGETKLFDVSGYALKMSNIDGNFRYATAGSDESDLSVAIQRDFGPAKLELREIYFGVNPERKLDNDWHAESLRLEFSAPYVTPYLKVWKLGEVGDYSSHGGWAGWVGVTRKNELPGVKLGGKNIAVLTDIYISAMWEDKKYKRGTGLDNFQACLSSPLPINKRFEIVPSVRFLIPFKTDCGNCYTIRNKQVWGVTFTVKF